MKKHNYIFLILCLLFTISASAQFKPGISFEELIISAETDVQVILEARKLAEFYNLPHTIYLPEGIFIEAKGIENNKVVYSIINDLLHPFNNGEVAFWEEINARFDLTEARVHWSNRPTQNPELGYNFTTQQNPVASFVMCPESTNDAVMSFNYSDGSLISAAYIPGGNPNLSTPIEALLTPNATILVSDQISDNIVEFDTLGAFVRILFGGNTSVLDNCRGIELRPGTNTVLATPSSGANQDAVAEFNLATGNYLGNFIAPNAAQMDGPWDIIFRAADCLVSGQASNNIVRYDLTGNYIGNFVASIPFPEQINSTLSTNVIVANFSSPSGLYIYDSNGNQLNYFSTISSARGCFQLGNGNYLVTNGSGVYVLDQNTGALLSTPVSGVSARSLHEYDLSIVPVELNSFTAEAINHSVVLNWTTATETNNSGFAVERSEDNHNYSQIGFVAGFGTTTEPKNYSYTDNSVSSGKYYYRLRQIDYDGSIEYSPVIEVVVEQPIKFSLEQNYPNPFNPSTTIKYLIPSSEFVTLKVYDILGNEMVELINEEKPAGSYSFEFDASNLASGTYFYKLQAGINTEVRKMLLLK